MRPQHITAENRSTLEADTLVALYASMRPQHITAENRQVKDAKILDRTASMRPQHITAENKQGGGAG